ncbi:MAG: carbon-nitrogen hydrolase family protein, partial [Planctomycetes bacterium]|nr:carbon-nitrogen hydrolase family protein [Planctomycetota bacterium]
MTRRMKVTVCELTNDPAGLEADWARLVEHVRAEASGLVVLPEMPFSRWLAASPDPVPDQWRESVRAHDAWRPRLAELGAERVVGTRPIV